MARRRSGGSRASIEVDGARELRAELKAAGIELDDLKAAHKEVAELVADRARTLAPSRTGRLRSSIRVSGAAGSSIVRAGGKTVPYALPIHYGWPRRGIRANPFIKEAAEEMHDEALQVYVRHLEQILSQLQGDS